jgi:hypothetical protein
VTIQQGLWGYVWFWEGNFMPGCPTGKVSAVSRELRIHELTSWDQVDHTSRVTFYSSIHTPLVGFVRSDQAGFFEIELPPGTYSVFALEDTLYYANGFDGFGNIYPVPVKEGEVTEIRFDIDYKSVF